MTGKVGFVSLGCPKALVDSEQILTRLATEGYETVDTYEAADVVVVNGYPWRNLWKPSRMRLARTAGSS